MYFNLYLNGEYNGPFDYIDINTNIDLYELKILITKIEARFNSLYMNKPEFTLAISNKDYDK